MIEWLKAEIRAARELDPSLDDYQVVQLVIHGVEVQLESDPLDRQVWEALNEVKGRPEPDNTPEGIYIASVDRALLEADEDYKEAVERLRADPEDDEAYELLGDMIQEAVDQSVGDGQLREFIDGVLQKYLGPAEK